MEVWLACASYSLTFCLFVQLKKIIRLLKLKQLIMWRKSARWGEQYRQVGASMGLNNIQYTLKSRVKLDIISPSFENLLCLQFSTTPYLTVQLQSTVANKVCSTDFWIFHFALWKDWGVIDTCDEYNRHLVSCFGYTRLSLLQEEVLARASHSGESTVSSARWDLTLEISLTDMNGIYYKYSTVQYCMYCTRTTALFIL